MSNLPWSLNQYVLRKYSWPNGWIELAIFLGNPGNTGYLS